MDRRSRVVLVTGVSSGIGRELVRELLARGHRVSGCARREHRLEQLRGEVGFDRERLHLVAADVNDEAACEAWLAGAVERFGGIDALVHNAGYGVQGPIEELSLSDFRDQFETNFFAVVRLTRQVLPRLEARGGGDLVFVSSILGHLGLPGRSPYCASKFAVEGFAESIRSELGPRGIRVSVINPGFTATEFAEQVTVRGVRPAASVSRAMPAREVARVIADGLGRVRRRVILTALGRAALAARAMLPGLFEWILARDFRRRRSAAGR